MNLASLKASLKKILEQAKAPVLSWSSGNDSTLILATLRNIDAKFSILQRRDLWTKEQKKRADKFIKEWDLTVYSYPAANISIVGDGEQISIISEHAVGPFKIPSVMDIIDGTRCIADLPKQRMEYAPFQFTDYIVGTKKSDRHYTFGDRPLVEGANWSIGDANFHAPLYDWTDIEVLDALDTLNIEPKTIDEGDAEYCSKCLHGVETYCPQEQKMIPPVAWNPQLNLENFRSAYSV